MRALVPLLLLLSAPALAVDYVQPAGAPQIYVPSYNVTVSVFAVQTPVGFGIGVFERRGTSWFLCNQCLVSPELPSMEAAVKEQGGPEKYVASKREAINAILASRYPASAERKSDATLDSVNKALVNGAPLSLVNGVPQLGSR
jgi:hypothetical protein